MIRSAAYRIAILASLAYAVTTLALGLAVYAAAHEGLRRQFDDRLSAEMSSLVSEFRLEGGADLRAILARRATARATNDLRYAIYRADGRRVAGDLMAAMPAPGLTTLDIPGRGGEADSARVLATDLGNGERLVVAADWDELEENDHLILSLLAAAFAAVVLIGVIGAFLLGAYLRRRLSAISDAAEAIMAGNLAQRVVVGPRGDEFDRLSLALNAMLDRIGELLDNLRQVSSDIAHDLRTPLSQLRNQLETGLDEGASPIVVERAIEQADEVLALFAAILRLSEIESGRLTASFTEIDLPLLVADLGESYAPAIEDGGRRLECRIETATPVRGDHELIAQAIVNLIENAQVHTPTGTEIRLSLSPIPTGLRLCVADDGPGVAEADRERITRRFARLEASRTRPGHGLGLSLVAAIARIHGATLAITDNHPGLRVTMDFPR